MEDRYLTSARNKNTGLYHGILMLNHPTPSGCERWMIQSSTKQGFGTGKEALEFIHSLYPDLLCYIDGELKNLTQHAPDLACPPRD